MLSYETILRRANELLAEAHRVDVPGRPPSKSMTPTIQGEQIKAVLRAIVEAFNDRVQF